MKKLFFHLLTFVCAGFTLLLAPGCNDDEGEKTGPTGDEGKEIYYGHEIEMYTVEQGEKRDKRQ